MSRWRHGEQPAKRAVVHARLRQGAGPQTGARLAPLGQLERRDRDVERDGDGNERGVTYAGRRCWLSGLRRSEEAQQAFLKCGWVPQVALP